MVVEKQLINEKNTREVNQVSECNGLNANKRLNQNNCKMNSHLNNIELQLSVEDQKNNSLSITAASLGKSYKVHEKINQFIRLLVLLL